MPSSGFHPLNRSPGVGYSGRQCASLLVDTLLFQHLIHVEEINPRNFSTGSSIAEIVSAFPTCGGLYTASAQLCPRKHRPIVGWVVGWMNILGQVAGVSSTEFGLANMIWAAVSIAKVCTYPDHKLKPISDSSLLHNRMATSPSPPAKQLACLLVLLSYMVSSSVELEFFTL